MQTRQNLPPPEFYSGHNPELIGGAHMLKEETCVVMNPISVRTMEVFG